MQQYAGIYLLQIFFISFYCTISLITEYKYTYVTY